MSKQHYSTTLKAIHWGTLLLVIAAFLSIEFREFYEKGTETRELFKFVHFQIGGLLLLLTIARLVIRKVQGVPDMVSMPKWQTAVAHGVHIALYACLIAMPILGVLTLVFAGKDTTVLGMEMQGWVAANKDFAHDLEEIHESIGEAFMWIIFLHAAGALVHHFVQKDDTLVKMKFSGR
ncbi:cytochrome b [Bermanella marisrubri]|uniref:Cytochrome b561 family protein n=1 Tax=Bermanella marisrubri TaxID=207949 RepID=Q1MYE4_9GAMM|nr:cytochrome b [Bermanella marisrubri]EAT11001.1 cytochrome b561 family protein [Oceanobacter sp. RED65] [Bermanella marisrubri]QIZ83754.1 cytochrome b [Bermanella marisrubri]